MESKTAPKNGERLLPNFWLVADFSYYLSNQNLTVTPPTTRFGGRTTINSSYTEFS
jgi:hypothetical protein